jgi:23S rRNA (pseudouridine1915-N3)-methyltransferase
MPETMKHQLLFLGKIKDRFIEDGVLEYTSRLQHYTSFSITVLKEKGRGRGKNISVAEQGEQLLQAVPPGATKVVLDSRGKQFTSEALSQKINQWEMQGIKQVCYLIGGPDGHAPEVIAAADLLVSLSKMTFTHDMARLLLVEQLYRAYTIKAGEQYHK